MNTNPNDHVLVGFNMPDPSLQDGDFDYKGKPYKLLKIQSDYWLADPGKDNRPIGLESDRLSSNGNSKVFYTTKSSIETKEIKFLKAGDIIKWQFCAQAEYISNARVSLSLIFSENENFDKSENSNKVENENFGKSENPEKAKEENCNKSENSERVENESFGKSRNPERAENENCNKSENLEKAENENCNKSENSEKAENRNKSENFEREEILTDNIIISNAPESPGEYSGEYIVPLNTKEMPKVRLTLSSDFNVKVFVEWIDIILSRYIHEPDWDVSAHDCMGGIMLTFNQLDFCDIYRSDCLRNGYQKIAQNKSISFLDSTAAAGRTYYYSLRRSMDNNSMPSYPIMISKPDNGITLSPKNLNAVADNWEITLSWDDPNLDTQYYNIYRNDVASDQLTLLSYHAEGTTFVDNLPAKSIKNKYVVTAVDFNGNESPMSNVAEAKIPAILGASFSDLILPLKITPSVTENTWGEPYTLPRDINNGIEDNQYSYWGGRIVKEGDMYHLNIVKWPENSRKGHWAWPSSTVSYATSSSPTGPFKTIRELAYTYTKQDGASDDNLISKGHNTNVILLKNGSYILYTLVNSKPILLSSESMKGPWKYKGEMLVNAMGYPRPYIFKANLSAIEESDGSLLFVGKLGHMMKSSNGSLLGPYDILTKSVAENETLPERYRGFAFEDPVLWKDHLQYHLIINGCTDLRAIYLRSPNGLDWFYEDGFAYTPTSTIYENGRRNLWHKMERPNVLVDEFGRATHLSLAVMDYYKDKDYPNDNHSSKNQVLPLVVYRRIKKISEDEILVYYESDLSNDFDISTIIFGSSKAVNYGRGSTVSKMDMTSDGVVLSLVGDKELSKNLVDFAAKLIGKTKDGQLVVGYCKWQE
ncbi:MAG: hypothetical protein ATN31_05120 [Candidatus Epulonipiscioides saccharophilum]|nr:MAG: hypothetical protein ATN31_05120 [Epulopiscium sp. AS2M-Bin001]